MNEILKAQNLKICYQAVNGEVEAVHDVSFSVTEGEFISIVGPSGCGKSTLLSAIAGITPITSGKILLSGKEVSGVCGDIAYMLQKDNLLEWRSIRKNVLIGLEVRNLLTQENLAYADRLLKTYGLWEFRDKYPAQLSGGMRQRAALIRTLAVRPKLLLLDEAFSALDYQTRLTVTDDVYKILKKEKQTALIVTHDIPESISMSDRVIVLSKRPAVIRKIYTTVFDIPNRSPLLCRDHASFGEYFNQIWKELDVHVS
ncbi:MAG: ABC transporter ATP-binding protein [Ruminococcaceae bacterium]|nr:ABC transporter ATP-binding protein [Oscillospiraceae bacterium]